LVDGYRAGVMLPQFYRGRVCYAKVAQAAEYHLRTEAGITGLDALRLESVEPADDEWIVQFRAVESGITYTLRLQEALYQIMSSCGDVEPETYTEYGLVNLSTAQS
jgi:hypothetical protein